MGPGVDGDGEERVVACCVGGRGGLVVEAELVGSDVKLSRRELVNRCVRHEAYYEVHKLAG